MSNKTSDKNVANIEEDIKYVKEMLEIARVFFKAVKAETNYKDVDDVAFCNAVEHILAEREQKDKRIQELEADLKSRTDNTNKLIEVTNLYLNSISRKAIIDKIVEVHNMKFRDDRLDSATIDFAVHKFEELLEGEE